MTVNIITSEDFELFQTELLKQLQEIKLLLGEIQKNKTIEYQGKKWLKSYQVQRMLGVSPAHCKI